MAIFFFSWLIPIPFFSIQPDPVDQMFFYKTPFFRVMDLILQKKHLLLKQLDNYFT